MVSASPSDCLVFKRSSSLQDGASSFRTIAPGFKTSKGKSTLVAPLAIQMAGFGITVTPRQRLSVDTWTSPPTSSFT